MPTSAIIYVIQWIFLYFSIHFLSLKADNCFRSDPQKCGNLTIPYPFHLHTTTCGLPGFEIACKKESSFDPEIPYLETLTGEVQVLKFSYDHILVDAAALYVLPCNSSDSFSEITKRFNLSDEGPFTISDFNNFFATGCQTYGWFKMYFDSKSEEWPYSGSCLSMCVSNHTIDGKRLSCKGKGCCQIPMPGGYTRISLSAHFDSFYGKENCSDSASAIVDKDNWETISASPQFKASRSSFRLDWAIPNDTCPSPKHNSSHQCSPNAACENKFWGYVCKCEAGYNGDGYINGTGCIEIKNCKGFSCFQTLSTVTGICGTLIAVLVGGGSVVWVLKLRKSKRDKLKNFQRNGGDHLNYLISSREGAEGLEHFSSEEIEKATKNFSKNLILGKGGYGTVYKGTLKDGVVVAVKKSKEVDSEEINKFINEIFILSQINHRNVVKLLGCCLETSVPLLVYEYISNGTLFDHLHGNNEEQQQLSWEQRLRIATETAEALSQLHSAPSNPIVHRDVKSANILLDNDYNPKVADFGVSRLVPMGQTHITTVAQGTMGYLDPEYVQTVKLTEKSDVYSFGVVLVELLTGLEAVSFERMENQSNLAIFFLSTVNETGFRELIDSRLDVNEGKNMESMRRVAGLATECLNVEGEKRPSMKEVVQKLKVAKDQQPDNREEMVGQIVTE